HAVGGDPVDRDAGADDARRTGERRLDRRLVAGLVEEGLVAGIVGPYRRRAGSEGGVGRDDGRQRLVVDRDPLGRVLCLLDGLGDEEGDWIADIPYVILRQQ